MTPFLTKRLDNGVTLEFFDLSNRYFGDYHRVRVEIRVTVPLPVNEVPPEAPPADLCVIKHLDRMGVSGADVEAMRNRLVEDYWCHAGPYLAHARFPARIAAAEALKNRDRSTTTMRRNDL